MCSVLDYLVPHGDRFPGMVHHLRPMLQRGSRSPVTDNHLTDGLVRKYSIEIDHREHKRYLSDFVDGDVKLELLIPHGVQSPPFDVRLLFVDAFTRVNQVDLDIWI